MKRVPIFGRCQSRNARAGSIDTPGRTLRNDANDSLETMAAANTTLHVSPVCMWGAADPASKPPGRR